MLHEKIDIKNNQYTFTDGRYYANDNGGWVPSVTTILEAYPKPYQLIQWLKEQGENADKIRDAAGKRGSNVHGLTEMYDNGHTVNLLSEDGNPMYSLSEWGMFERYIDFSQRFKPQHLLIEQNIVGNEYAGTIDRVTTLDGKKYIIDIKTSNVIAKSYWLQLAAYERLLNNVGIYVDGTAILHLNAATRTDGKKGDIQGKGWKLYINEEGRYKDGELFMAVHKIWLHEHAEDKPKLFTYQLSHAKG